MRFSICVAKPNDAAVDGLRDLIATLGDESQNFQFENVARSLTQLHEIQMAIVSDFATDPAQDGGGSIMRAGTTIQGIGIRDSPSKVTVEIYDGGDGLPLEQNPEVRAINDRFPGAVMFTKVYSRTVPVSGGGGAGQPTGRACPATAGIDSARGPSLL